MAKRPVSANTGLASQAVLARRLPGAGETAHSNGNTNGAHSAMALALRLIHAEHALQELSSGQLDAVVDANGQPYLLRPAQDHLRWESAFFEAQVESALDGILVVNQFGKKVLQNRRMVELWKIPPDIAESSDDARQVEFVTSQTKEPRKFAEKVAHLYAHPDEIGRDEIELIDGTILDRYSAPVRGKTGFHYGRIWTFRDVTGERRREKTLSDALRREQELVIESQAGTRAKSEFLAVMSHEIRTPLNGILGFSELLATSPHLPADCRDYVRTIASSGESLLRILDDVLALSRLEAGGLSVESSRFSIREILQDTHTLLAPQAVDKRLDFHLACDDDLPEQLWNDAGRLRQVLLNLVGNAIKFTDYGTILLGTRWSPKSTTPGTPGVEFFVRDTGPGISDAVLAHIFEPFAQGDSSISRRFGGTGLGLTISHRLVELMAGELRVQSEVGRGTEFSVTLAAGVPEGAASVLPEATPVILDKTFAQANPLRVLIVEDEPVNLKLMGIVLRGLGYDPSIARDGVEAVESYRREQPDCILMDLQMPGLDGIQATAAIREIENSSFGRERTFIVAVTANVAPEDQRRCFAAGMDLYLTKPIRRDQLATTLRRASQRQRVPARG